MPRDDDRCVWSEDSKKMVDNQVRVTVDYVRMIFDLSQITFFYSLPFQTGEWMEITRDVLVDAARALSTVKEKGRTKKEGNVILRPGE